MTTKEKLQETQAHWQSSEVLLVREGLFWRAYEHSALALCDLVSSFKVSTHYVKCIEQWISYVGFPDHVKNKWLASRQVNAISDGMLIFSVTEDEKQSIDVKYPTWKHLHVCHVEESNEERMTSKKECCNETSNVYGKQRTTEDQVLQMVRSFAIENATPLVCMNFVANIKQMLYEEKV